MTKKPTYAELEQRVAKLQNERPKHKAVKTVTKDKKRPALNEVLSDLIDVMDIAMWELDMNYRVISSNRKAKEIYGEESVGDFCYVAASGQNAVCPDCPAKVVYNGQNSGRSEHRRTDISGKTIYIDHIATPIRDKSGKMTGILVLIIDITRHKLMEQEIRRHRDRLDELVQARTHELLRSEKSLREKEQRYRALFQHTNDAVLFISPDNICLDANPQAVEMLGYEIEELIGMSVQNLIASDEFDGTRRRTDALLASRTPPVYESVLCKKDGSEFPAEINIAVIYDAQGNPMHTQIVVRNIKERKQAEEAIRKSQYKLAAHIKLIPMGVIDFNNKFEIISWNPEAEKIFGYTEEEAIGSNALDTIVPEYEHNGVRKIHLLTEPKSTENINDNRTKDGRIITCHWFNTPILNRHGKRVGMTAVCQDISDKIRAEEEIRLLRKRLDNIINSMPSALIGIATHGLITHWNDKAAQITGISANHAIGKLFVRLLPQYDDQFQKITTAIRNKHPEITRKIKRHVNNTVCYEDITIYPLIANGRDGAVIRIDDVTEQVRLEEMMIQNEKMLSVGGLAAGMAHEINNPLAGMMQTANNMSNRLTDANLPANRRAAETAGMSMGSIRAFMESRGILRMLATINESGRRVAEIVDNMLSFARKSDAGVSSHDVTRLLDSTLDLASTDYDLKKKYDFKNIEIVKDYEKNFPLVSCEGAKIQQVFLNILRNGAQAMHTADIPKPTFILKAWYAKKRAMVCFKITDNGPGMEEAVRKRVFEPFFTTKPVDVGTGLGLSVSYFIITENHGGEMNVESVPGRGTSFIIRLPVEKESHASCRTSGE